MLSTDLAYSRVPAGPGTETAFTTPADLGRFPSLQSEPPLSLSLAVPRAHCCPEWPEPPQGHGGGQEGEEAGAAEGCHSGAEVR